MANQIYGVGPRIAADPTGDSIHTSFAADQEPIPLGRVLARIEANLAPTGVGAGPLAEIRRMTPPTLPPAFWRLYLSVVPREWREPTGSWNAQRDFAWAGLIRAMAEVAPISPVSTQSIGKALGTSGYSEARFVRLLRAEAENLSRELRVAARWLAIKGERADWLHPAKLLLGRPSTGLPVDPERAAHQLASDYFRAQDKP